MNLLYPIFLKLEGCRCIVVGGGKVALRKVESLLECGARVQVVAPRCEAALEKLSESGRIECTSREFRGGDLEGARLVIAAADDEPVNQAVSQEAARRNVLCNIVDQPDLCDFYVPSSLRRGDLKIAISTNGKAPAIAAGFRRRLEKLIGEDFGRILEEAEELRRAVRRAYPDDPQRRGEILKELIDADTLLEAAAQRDSTKVDAILESWRSYSSG